MECKCLKRQWTPPVHWESRRSWPTTCQRDCGSSRHPPKGCWTRWPSRSFQISSDPHVCHQMGPGSNPDTHHLCDYVSIANCILDDFTSTRVRLHSFCRPENWARLHCVLCLQSHEVAVEVSQPGPGSHLEARLKKTPIPRLNGGWQHSVLQPCICRPESFKAFCRRSAPRGH